MTAVLALPAAADKNGRQRSNKPPVPAKKASAPKTPVKKSIPRKKTRTTRRVKAEPEKTNRTKLQLDYYKERRQLDPTLSHEVRAQRHRAYLDASRAEKAKIIERAKRP